MQKLAIGMAILAALLVGGVGAARAQESDAEVTAAARALFDSGMAAVDAGDFHTATDHLSRSIALRDSPVTRTNLALALIELGHLVSASEHLRFAIRTARPDSRVHELATQFLRELTPRLGQLRISVTGAAEGTEVRLDGTAVPEALIGVRQPVDPGNHTIALLRGDNVLSEQRVQVAAGRSSSVTLVARAPTAEEAAAAAAASATATQSGQDESGSVAEEAWFWILIGVLVLGAGAGITVGILVANAQPDYQLGDSGFVHPTLLEVEF